MPNWNATITHERPESLVGMLIEKDGTLSKCIGVGSYITKSGEKIQTLEWEVLSKVTGHKKMRWTKIKFIFSSLPNFFKGEGKI